MLTRVRQIFLVLLLGINLLIGTGLLMGAYGQYVSPLTFPYISVAGLAFPIFLWLNVLCLIGWLVLKKKYALLSLAFIVLSGDAVLTYFPLSFAQEPTGGPVLKVLTYNVEWMPTKTDKQGKTVNPILDYIKNSGADIVCMQEFPLSNDKIIKQLKSVYPYSNVLSVKNGLGVACLSKHRIISSKNIKIESSGNGAGLYYIKYGKKKLPLIIAHLESNKLNDNDKKFYESMLSDPKHNIRPHDSKHLIGKLVDAAVMRAAQADIIVEKIKSLNDPLMLVCGDFNDVALSYSHRVIAENLQDVYRESYFGPRATYNQHYMFFRIDHILAGKGYRVLRSKVDRSIDASDHYPFWCELEIPKNIP